jgi:hypothetical protein
MVSSDRQQDPEHILARLTAYATTPEGVLRRLTRYAQDQQPPLPPAPAPPEGPVFQSPVVDEPASFVADLRRPNDDLLPAQPPRRRGLFGFRRRSRVRSGSRHRAQ